MDFLGYVRVRVDRSKPLAQTPEVWLDRDTAYPPDYDHRNAIGRLYLDGKTLVFFPATHTGTLSLSLPVSECIAKG